MKKRNSQRCKSQRKMGGPAAADPGAERKVGKSRGGRLCFGQIWKGQDRGGHSRNKEEQSRLEARAQERTQVGIQRPAGGSAYSEQ